MQPTANFKKQMPIDIKTQLNIKEGKQLIGYGFFWSAMLLLAVPFACIASGEGFATLLQGLFRIWFSPSKLITDYFELGGVGAAFLNAAICGFACNFAMLIVKAKPNATLLAGYFLVIAHCFYGLNFINMWLPFLGIGVYCLVKKQPYSQHLHMSFFCTSLGPFISDFLFRYTLGDNFDANNPKTTVWGIILSVCFSLLAGFLVPALLPGTTRMHRGYNLYKAGLAIGLFGVFAFAFFYKCFGIDAPEVIYTNNDIYEANNRSYFLIANVFFGIVFLATLICGWVGNGKSLKGYKTLLHLDGWQDDFTLKRGMPLTLINIGLYGFCVLAYLDAIIIFTEGVGFTGPTVGVTIAAITFSACGQHPKNVWPIAAGYMLLVALVFVFCTLAGMDLPISISHQGYINGLAFATGLCPFTGRYGRKYGVIAGMLSAVLCTSTAAMHGGFVLYNGGFTAGLAALLLLPILEFYKVPVKPDCE